MSYLTFDTEQKALSALSVINSNKGYSIVAVNAETGLPEPSRQQTTKWAEAKKAYELDKWYFPNPGDKYVIGAIDYTEEDYAPSWAVPTEVLG